MQGDLILLQFNDSVIDNKIMAQLNWNICLFAARSVHQVQFDECHSFGTR